MKTHVTSATVALFASILIVGLPLRGAPEANFSAVGEIASIPSKANAQAAARTIAIDTSTGDAGRILAQPGESFSVRLALAGAKADQPLHVSAGMGGVIDGKQGPLVRKQLGNPNLSLTFTVGGDRGRYLLEIKNGRESQTLEFWVGGEPPQGKPGPQRTFTAPQP